MCNPARHRPTGDLNGSLTKSLCRGRHHGSLSVSDPCSLLSWVWSVPRLSRSPATEPIAVHCLLLHIRPIVVERQHYYDIMLQLPSYQAACSGYQSCDLLSSRTGELPSLPVSPSKAIPKQMRAEILDILCHLDATPAANASHLNRIRIPCIEAESP
jgi:hypothetical protein